MLDSRRGFTVGDGRWAKAVTERCPKQARRSVDRSGARWVDDLVKVLGRV